MNRSKSLLIAVIAAIVATIIGAGSPAVEVSDSGTRVRVSRLAEAVKWPEWPGYRLPDLRIGRWWYKAPPKVGKEVHLFFEIENVGRRTAPGPILWEVTCHNWGFWTPVLNRIAVSYSRRSLLPGQSKVVHISFPMTRRTHNLRLMADPSDHLGPPDNPPFGQKAKLHGWLSLKDGHIRERNERNNARWVCIRVFRVKPAEIAAIPIPVVNPLPGMETEVAIELGEDLAKVPDVLQVGVLDEKLAVLAVANDDPPIKPVQPGDIIAKFQFNEANEEGEVVLLASLLDDILLTEPVSFTVLATAIGPDGEPIFAEVTVVLEMDTELQNDVVLE